MIIKQYEFYKEFEKIRKSSLSHSSCKLAIFVSCFDIDAMCSSKMISEYFKKNFILFQLIPVIGYLDLKEKYNKLDLDIYNIILIGCGAITDLESFLEIDLNNHLVDIDIEKAENLINIGNLDKINLNRKIYVIDGHRPWNLDNLFGSPIICCLDDNSTNDLNNEKDAFYYLINIPDDDQDENGEDDDDDEDDEIEELAETDDDNESLDLQDSLDRKRQLEEPRISKKKKRKLLINEYQELIESYYQQGSTISMPSSYQMYDVLSSIGEINLNNLWLSIIGVRSLKDFYPKVYEISYPGLKNEVLRLQSDENDNGNGNGNASNGNGNNNDNEKLSKLSSFNASKKADNKSLQTCKEYSLFLLHHWTLYDSFFYSNYINSKCHLYTNDGRRLLKTMFARMGISLNQANQNWHYLDLDLKKKIDLLINREVKKFNLNDVIIKGFKRNFGFHGSISSSDYFESIQALLETNIIKDKDISNGNNGNKFGDKDSDENDSGSGNGNGNEADKSNDENSNKNSNNKSNINNEFLKSFWRAFDSLNNYNSILDGMKVAKFQQQFIFEKGSEIIQKGMVKTQSKFKVLILNESFTSNTSITRSNFNDSTFNKSLSSLKDDRVVDIKSFGNGSKMFQNPLILTKLGNWILNVQSELDDGLLPLLIGAYNGDTNTYLICGLPSRMTFDDDDDDEEGEEEEEEGANGSDIDNEDYSKGNRKQRKARNGKNTDTENKRNKQKVILNAFSVLFEKVTQEISIQARMDSFQSAIIELRKEDLTRFLDGLNRYSQYMM